MKAVDYTAELCGHLARVEMIPGVRGRLEIAMDDPASCARETFGDLCGDLYRTGRGEHSARNYTGEWLSSHQLHRDEADTVGFADLMNDAMCACSRLDQVRDTYQ